MSGEFDFIGINMFDEEETHENCTVQVLRNTQTGEESVGWWKNDPIVKCCDCKHWKTPIAYVTTGKCKLHDRITNRNYFCADGKEKE